jgi:DNA-binding NtrC family response regulator
MNPSKGRSDLHKGGLMEKHYILIVDDEPSVRSSLARLFQKEGYDTLLAESAEEGLAALEKRSFSVVISDDGMPGRSGIDFLTEVKCRYPEPIRILLISDSDKNEGMPAVDNALISHRITKPWDSHALKKTIRRLIEAFERAHPGQESPDETEGGVVVIEEQETATIPDEFLHFLSPTTKKIS